MLEKEFFPLNQKQILYFSYARVALFHGLQVLGLKPTDEVLVPDYICNVVLAPFHESGIRTVYYKINNDLTPHWDNVKSNLTKNTKALLMINYFGIPNDLDNARQFCDQHHLFFIEDNAHGFLSSHQGRPLGSWGDISIFAFHKSLCIPSGAAVVFSKDLAQSHLNIQLRHAALGVFFYFKVIVQRIKKLLGFPLNTEKLIRQMHPTEDDKKQEFELNKYLLKIPVISRFILNHIQVEPLKEKRRKKYQDWLKYFSKYPDADVKIIFPELAQGVCPMVFPVYVKDPKLFIQSMAEKKISSYIWPYKPHNSPENNFSEHLVCLPLV